ncbi:hypothetical protein R6V09_54270, partial [Streptomyces sp. W16]|nr:hypothetical protein [Streptomyces sp. W16]
APRTAAHRTAAVTLVLAAGATDPHAGELARLLRERGATTVLVRPGDGCRQIDPGLYEAGPDQFQHLVDQVSASAGGSAPDIDVVCCWSAPDTPGSPGELADAARPAVERVLALVKVTAPRGGNLRLRLVTAGAQPVGSGPGTVLPALWWGLGRTLAIEHPALDLRLLDLPLHPTTEDLAALADDLLTADPEPYVALRTADDMPSPAEAEGVASAGTEAAEALASAGTGAVRAGGLRLAARLVPAP